MNELLQKGQEMSVVPQDYRFSNKGEITELANDYFVIHLQKEPGGIIEKSLVEFYTQTKHGTLFFESAIAKIDKDKIVVTNPKKHRFLQRRVFTRVKFIQDIQLKLGEEVYTAKTLDLAAGAKLSSFDYLSLNDTYDMSLELPGGSIISCKYLPVKIEKNDDGVFTVAGKFIDINSNDQIKIIQYCLRKDVEYNRR